MTQPAADAQRPAATPVDLGGIDSTRRDGETVLDRVGIAVAQTAAGVTGVHHLGGDVARSLGRASRAVLGKSNTAGVSVAEIEGEIVVDLDIVVQYPHRVTGVAEEARKQVVKAAAPLTSLPVVVNVTVADVFGPGDRDRVAEADEAITNAVNKTKKAASEAAARTKDAAGRAAEATKRTASDVADRSREVAADVQERSRDAAADIREGAAKAVDAARDGAARAADSSREGAARAADSSREGAARAADAIDEGVTRARNAAADATERLDEELAKRGQDAPTDQTETAARTEPASAAAGGTNITVVVEEGASVTVDADDRDDVEITAAKKDERSE